MANVTLFSASEIADIYVLAINTIKCTTKVFMKREKMETLLTISARSSILDV